jgi:hypothetical protein
VWVAGVSALACIALTVGFLLMAVAVREAAGVMILMGLAAAATAGCVVVLSWWLAIWVDRVTRTVTFEATPQQLRCDVHGIRGTTTVTWPRSEIAGLGTGVGLEVFLPDGRTRLLEERFLVRHGPAEVNWLASVLVSALHLRELSPARRQQLLRRQPPEPDEVPVEFSNPATGARLPGYLLVGRGWLRLRSSVSKYPVLSVRAAGALRGKPARPSLFPTTIAPTASYTVTLAETAYRVDEAGDASLRLTPAGAAWPIVVWCDEPEVLPRLLEQFWGNDVRRVGGEE